MQNETEKNTAIEQETKQPNNTANEKSILDRIGGDKYAYSDVLG